MNLNLMKTLCAFKVNELKNQLIDFLKEYNYKPIYKEHFIIAEGTLPICLIAHMDTVFYNPPKIEDFLYDKEKHILWSPAGSGFDDRVGIYIIIRMISKGYKPHIIFTDLEEEGGIGAQELIEHFPNCPFKYCSCLIELDRANEKDMVFYDCYNQDFIEYISSFNFEEEWGTFTDISFIAEPWGIAAVNLSVGYLDQHTIAERLNTAWCDATISKLEKILLAAPRMKTFKYIPFHNNYCLICNKYIGLEKKYKINNKDPYVLCKDCLDLYYAT